MIITYTFSSTWLFWMWLSATVQFIAQKDSSPKWPLHLVYLLTWKNQAYNVEVLVSVTAVRCLVDICRILDMLVCCEHETVVTLVLRWWLDALLHCQFRLAPSHPFSGLLNSEAHCDVITIADKYSHMCQLDTVPIAATTMLLVCLFLIACEAGWVRVVVKGVL